MDMIASKLISWLKAVLFNKMLNNLIINGYLGRYDGVAIRAVDVPGAVQL